MGKPSGKKKNVGGKVSEPNAKKNKHPETHSKAFDEDTAMFISTSHELKEEGNKLFQKRDHEGAMLKYKKALKLLPKNHIDVAYLRSNLAACFMQMGPGEYDKAVHECNLALEVSPKYGKALLKRARCYEALNRMELAFRDASTVLSSEPNNIMALEIADRVKKALEDKGIQVDGKQILTASEYVEPAMLAHQFKPRRMKAKKNKGSSRIAGSNPEDKAIIQEKPAVKVEPPRSVKIVYGEDIRSAQTPANCTILQVREIVRNRFPGLEALLIKYKDKEGDLVTITTTEELRFAESLADPQSSLRLHVAEVNPDQDPLFEMARKLEIEKDNSIENGQLKKELEYQPTCMEDWTIHFALLFKNHVGFSSDAYLGLHELGMKIFGEAIEDVVTGEEAQRLLAIAADKFQEMTALALFNWGNVHMSRARKKISFPEEASRDVIVEHIKEAFELSKKEYEKAGEKYNEAVKLKPDFYEGLVAIGQQQFEQAKLSWYYAVSTNVDLETWPCTEVIDLYDRAEANIASGAEMWEEIQGHQLADLLKPEIEKSKSLLQKIGLDEIIKDMSADEVADQASNLRSQLNLLWGSLLYERSIVEFKLRFEYWEDCLEAAIEKFEEAGASPVDIAVMRKSHCSNDTAQEGLVFKIDEIVQAWNEMYDAKRWLGGFSSFRLEPLLRRRPPKLHHIFEAL